MDYQREILTLIEKGNADVAQLVKRINHLELAAETKDAKAGRPHFGGEPASKTNGAFDSRALTGDRKAFIIFLALAFAALFLFHLPFPIVVLGAGAIEPGPDAA